MTVPTTPATTRPNRAARVRTYTREVLAQLRATTWPSPRSTAHQCGVVLGFLILMVALIGGADTLAGAAIQRLLG